MTEVSAVVVSYNSATDLPDCLRSLRSEGVADVVYNRALSIIAEKVLPPLPPGDEEELPVIDVANEGLGPNPLIEEALVDRATS